MPCFLTCYESGRKSCANQTSFLSPVVSGGQVAGSAMHLLLLHCGGRTVMQRAQQSCLQPSWSKPEHSVVVRLATAIAADLRSLHSLHSVVLGAIRCHLCGFEVAAQPALGGALHSR